MVFQNKPPKETYRQGNNQKKKKPEQKKPKQNKKRFSTAFDAWNRLAIIMAVVMAITCTSVMTLVVGVVTDEDGMRFSQDGLKTVSNSRIFDADDNLVLEFGEEIREDITYDDVPQCMIDAFLSIEDSRFFTHNGFDLPRFISAGINNLRSGGLGQGGSTLTMQMIDNAFTKNQETKLQQENGGYISTIDKLKLKIQEIYLAMVSEQNLTKEDIFEYYINRIWFGSGGATRGLQKACKYFFNKDVSQINLGEAAFLAGAVNSPATYNPLNNRVDDSFDYLESATKRRNVTLQLMLNHGYITEEEYNLTVNTKLEFALKSTKTVSNDPNEAYIDQVIQEVIDLTGIDPLAVPLDIHTALRQDVQKEAYKICLGQVDDVTFYDDKFDIGFTVIENKTGEIWAVGPGRTYHKQEATMKIDNSTDRKQPGSSMKPLLAYGSTFDMLGWSTKHTLQDVAKDYWKAGFNLGNSDHIYRGPVTFEYALGHSLNTTAAQSMLDLLAVSNTDYWINFCEKLGYDEDVCKDFNEQYSIGGSNMWASPIQQTSAYTMFGNGGTRIEAHRVRSVQNRVTGDEYQGNTQSYDLLSSGACFMMSQLLEKVVTGGHGSFAEALKSDWPVYAKSGTSDWGDAGLAYGIPAGECRDEWSMCYTDTFTFGCWSGYTKEWFTKGYYLTGAQLYQDRTAFFVNKHMMDFIAKYANNGKGYKPIARPDGVADYKGGYILSKFADTGDVTTIIKDDKPKKEETEETEDDKQKACENAGGAWDSIEQKCKMKPVEEPVKTPAQITCESTGGTWNNGCACPADMELRDDGTCQIKPKVEEPLEPVIPDPPTSEEPTTPDPPTEPVDPPTSEEPTTPDPPTNPEPTE